MNKILISYADKGEYYLRQQARNTASGMKAGFDKVIEMSRKDIDEDFLNDNREILENKRGAGYWLWKPYIINKILNSSNIQEGDIIFYTDVDAVFIDNVKPLIDIIEKENILLFTTKKFKASTFTKRDTFFYMKCDSKEYYNLSTITAGYQGYKKCQQSREFVSEYLKLCTDPRLIVDKTNKCGKPELPDFKDHRHDQSILNLFAYKKGIPLHKCPTHWSRQNAHLFAKDKYDVIILNML